MLKILKVLKLSNNNLKALQERDFQTAWRTFFSSGCTRGKIRVVTNIRVGI
jgi:hypothetical protein